MDLGLGGRNNREGDEKIVILKMSSRTPPALSKVEVIRDPFQDLVQELAQHQNDSGPVSGMTLIFVILNLPAGRQACFRIRSRISLDEDKQRNFHHRKAMMGADSYLSSHFCDILGSKWQ